MQLQKNRIAEFQSVTDKHLSEWNPYSEKYKQIIYLLFYDNNFFYLFRFSPNLLTAFSLEPPFQE